MHCINYLLVIALVAIVIALIIDARRFAPPKPPINKCPSCGALASLTGDFFDSHVRCSNLDCAMTGPKGRSDEEAISFWNNLRWVQPAKHLRSSHGRVLRSSGTTQRATLPLLSAFGMSLHPEVLAS